jgi:hypothetical protein
MSTLFCPVCHGIEKAIVYLEKDICDGIFQSFGAFSPNGTNPSQTYPEIFSSIMIASILPHGERFRNIRTAIVSCIKERASRGLFSFFADEKLVPDADTNAVGYAMLLENGSVLCRSADRILDSIVEYCNSRGEVQVWLSCERENYTDPVVGANVLYLARLLGRDRELTSTVHWLLDILDDGNPCQYSRYYHSPYALLFFVSRLLGILDFCFLRRSLWNLWQRVVCASEMPKGPLDLAMRIFVAESLGIDSMQEKLALIAIQAEDGSWPADALYREGKRSLFYCNTSVPTAFAVSALYNTCGHAGAE